jgi:hypothetical protein
LKIAGSSLGYKHNELTKEKMSVIKKSDPNLHTKIKGKDSIN